MKRHLSALALVAACLACLLTAANARQLSFDLKPLNGSGESGTATIARTADGKLVITLSLTGEPAGASQPAHIHPGSCENINPVPKVGLENVVGGKSVTTIPAPPAPPSGARSIVVHKGPGADMNTYVACGDIPSH